MNTVYYRKGYKYQLAEPYVGRVCIRPDKHIATDFIILSTDGILMIKAFYAWDGCSGPTIDTKTNLRGGLVHDALCQLARLGHIPEEFHPVINLELRRICIEDGMNRIRSWLYFEGTDIFGDFAHQPGNEPYPVLTAP